jgi:hypothetical protein
MLSETFEKCSILFKVKEGDPALAGLTTQMNMLRIPQGRQTYF